MSRAGLLLLLVAIALPARALGSHLFVSTERPFPPGAPGAIVKIEVRGARSVDVRLYRIAEPERFFATQRDLHHPGPFDAHREAKPSKRPEPAARTPGPFALLSRPIYAAASDAREALRQGLTPAALALLSSSAKLPRASGPQTLPFLRGLELVERWDLACGSQGEFSFCDVDIGPRSAGVYLVEATSGREVAHAVAIVSSLSVVTRRSEGQLALLVVDARTGQPVEKAAVALYSQGQVQRGLTGKHGVFSSKVAGRPTLVLVQRGQEFAAVEAEHFTVEVPEHLTWLTTDRGEYRPGERLTFFGVARSGDDRLALSRSEEAELTLHDARGSPVGRAVAPLSAQGTFTGELEIPAGLPQGLFRLVASLDGQRAAAELVVRRPSTPAFELQAKLEGTRAGSPLQLRLDVNRDGRGLAGVKLSWRLTRSTFTEEEPAPSEIARGELTSDEEGVAAASVETPGDVDARYELAVSGKDQRGRIVSGVARLALLRGALRAGVSTEQRLATPGAAVQVVIVARDASDAPVAAPLKVLVRAARAGATGEAAKVRIAEKELSTGADGRASFSFVPTVTGYYEIDLWQGALRLAETFIYVTSEGGDIPFTPESLKLVPERSSYAPGETARVLVLAPFDAATALVTVESGELLRAEPLLIRNSSAVVQVKIGKELGAGFTLSVQAAVSDATYRRQVSLRVLPRPEPLLVKATPSRVEGEGLLGVELTDRAGKPLVGAELFATAIDGRIPESAAPGIFGFFHPEPLSEGATASSTSWRSASSGALLARGALDGFEEGTLPFKSLSAGRPRGLDSGTLLAATQLTDGHGRASFHFPVPLDAGRISLSLRAVAGPAMGDWSGALDAAPAASLVAPRFLRAGDSAQVVATRQGSGGTLVLESGAARSPATGARPAVAALTVQASGLRVPLAMVAGAARTARDLPVVGPELEWSGESGIATVGRARLPEGSGDTVLTLTTSARAAGRAMRATLGSDPEPLSARAITRLLASVAKRKGQGRDAAASPGELRDVAALLGLAHPEGGFGGHDGAPTDGALSVDAVIALGLAREEGLEIEEGLLSRCAARLAESPLLKDDPGVVLALALAEEPLGARLPTLLAAERAGTLGLEARAELVLALRVSDDRTRARELAESLERSVRMQGALACLSAEPCPTDGKARGVLRRSALGMLALAATLPRSPALLPLGRFLLLARGRGDFGGDVAGGLAALAVATAGEEPAKAATALIELAGKRLTSLKVGADELRVEVPPGELQLTVAGSPIIWRLERVRKASAEAVGPIAVTRTLEAIERDGRRSERALRVGDRVEVALSLAHDGLAGPVRIDDPFPACVAPVEQEGSRESWLELDENARRLVLGDRVVFLFPGLKGSRTVVRYEATVTCAGSFTAPPVTVAAGAQSGRSAASSLVIGEAP